MIETFELRGVIATENTTGKMYVVTFNNSLICLNNIFKEVKPGMSIKINIAVEKTDSQAVF